MSAKPWHRRYHSDALTGMLSLSLEERGAYQTILDLIYDRQGPIPDNDRLLAGYMGCSLRKWKALRERLIYAGKIVATCGLLTNPRAEKEIENDVKTARKLAENGSKGGRKKAENAENSNEINETNQAPLEPGSSLPEARGSDTNVSAAEAPRNPVNPVKAMFDLGEQILTNVGRSKQQARTAVGRWRNALGDAKCAGLLIAAQSKSDPAAFMEAQIRNEGRDTDALYSAIDRKYGGERRAAAG